MTGQRTERQTKKELSLALFDDGMVDIETLADRIGASPAYIAATLLDAGRDISYRSLYTPSRPRNRYGDDFAGVLRFKNEEAARESVRQIDRLYHHYRESRDRPGQYEARSMALIGYERAIGLGKTQEARLFADWLMESIREEIEAAPAPVKKGS